MALPIYITGPAGTGKTYTLLMKAAELGGSLIRDDHQSLLAITFMHGSRQRLDTSLADHPDCSRLRRCVGTIDGFALQILNQWRASLGFSRPLLACGVGASQHESDLGIHLPYAQIVKLAADLLGSRTVRTSVANSFPLLIVDEFQDCVGDRLRMIEGLASFLPTILAADPFQLLDQQGGSPATDWVEALPGIESTTLTLKTNRRTNQTAIINGANALRNGTRAVAPNIRVEVVPRGRGNTLGLAASKILYSLKDPRRSGVRAVIFPSGINEAAKIVESITNQCAKKGFVVPRHRLQVSAEDEVNDLVSEVSAALRVPEATGQPTLGLDGRDLLKRMESFQRLRGLPGLEEGLVRRFAEMHVHAKRAYGQASAPLLFTTIHGAKNREFDHVFVVWGYRLQNDFDQQRRLLYNAVTRAKVGCTILDTRTPDAVTRDPLMRLLGDPVVPTSKPKKPLGPKKLPSR